MEISQERLDEFKRIFKEDYGKEYTDAEAREAASNLLDFFELLIKMAREDDDRIQKLKEFPRGYSLPGEGRNCPVCGRMTMEDMWYDKWGFKCMTCQKALEKHVYPGKICKDWEHKTWFSTSDLQYKAGLKYPTIAKYVRNGQLKPRVIQDAEGRTQAMIFLDKENPGWRKSKP